MLSDGEWARPKAALETGRSGVGRPFPDQRRMVEAVIRRQGNGAEWRAGPPHPAVLVAHYGLVESFNSRVGSKVLGITIWCHQDFEALLRGFDAVDSPRRQRVLGGKTP